MTDQSIELKGTNFTLSVIHLFEDQIDKIKAGLQEKVAQAPSFFKFAPIVINVSHIPNFNQWSDLKTVLNDLDLCLVGISGCKDPMIKSTINKSGLAVLTEGKAIVPNKPSAEQPLEQETKPSYQNHTATAQSLTAPITPNKTKVITTPIRSGQQIYAKNTDLIIMNNVGAGAEIIADGNIHVYGIMRGKAIAGATGDESAQIFCKHLEAELISIAGNYWLSDKINNEFIGQSVVINYNNNQLNIQLL